MRGPLSRCRRRLVCGCSTAAMSRAWALLGFEMVTLPQPMFEGSSCNPHAIVLCTTVIQYDIEINAATPTSYLAECGDLPAATRSDVHNLRIAGPEKISTSPSAATRI